MNNKNVMSTVAIILAISAIVVQSILYFQLLDKYNQLSAELSSKSTNLEFAYNELVSRWNELNTSSKQLNISYQNLVIRYESLRVDLESSYQNLTIRLDSLLTSYGMLIANFTERCTEIETQIDKVNQTSKTQISRLNSSINEMEAFYYDLETEFNILNTTCNQLNLSVSALETSINDLETSINELNNKYTELETRLEELSEKVEVIWAIESGVIWQYGGGPIKANMEKLIHPRYAEETPDETILISDYEGNCVFEIGRDFTLKWEYTNLNRPCGAHRLDNGNTLIADSLNQRVIEVDEDGKIVWLYDTGTPVYDSILFDDYVVMTLPDVPVVRKIRYSTKETEWEKAYPAGSSPRSIQRIVDQHAGRPSFAPGRDGDYLIGSARGYVTELRDSDQSIVFSYGAVGEMRHAHDRLAWAASATIGWSDINSCLMFITDGEYGRVFAINRDKVVVWQYGWSYPYDGNAFNNLRPGPLLQTPDSVRFTKHGNLLIADSGGSKVIEVVFKDYKVPREWAHLFYEEEIRDTNTHDSFVAETG